MSDKGFCYRRAEIQICAYFIWKTYLQITSWAKSRNHKSVQVRAFNREKSYKSSARSFKSFIGWWLSTNPRSITRENQIQRVIERVDGQLIIVYNLFSETQPDQESLIDFNSVGKPAEIFVQIFIVISHSMTESAAALTESHTRYYDQVQCIWSEEEKFSLIFHDRSAGSNLSFTCQHRVLTMVLARTRLLYSPFSLWQRLKVIHSEKFKHFHVVARVAWNENLTEGNKILIKYWSLVLTSFLSSNSFLTMLSVPTSSVVLKYTETLLAFWKSGKAMSYKRLTD